MSGCDRTDIEAMKGACEFGNSKTTVRGKLKLRTVRVDIAPDFHVHPPNADTNASMSGCDRTDIEAMKEDRRQKAAAKRAAAGPEDETAPAAAEPAQVFDAPAMAGAPR
eukprot:scaffold131495_cov54-Phaeocystis_antarctica.AAC.1